MLRPIHAVLIALIVMFWLVGCQKADFAAMPAKADPVAMVDSYYSVQRIVDTTFHNVCYVYYRDGISCLPLPHVQAERTP